MRAALGSENLFEPWLEIRDADSAGATLAALAAEAAEQSIRGTASAIGAALAEERRGRAAEWKAAEWKAAVDASLDLPDPSDLDAMLPEITGEEWG